MKSYAITRPIRLHIVESILHVGPSITILIYTISNILGFIFNPYFLYDGIIIFYSNLMILIIYNYILENVFLLKTQLLKLK